MKKLLALALVVLMAALTIAPISAAEMVNTEFENAFGKLPSEYEDGETIALGSLWADGKTNARHATADKFDYIFLKNDGKGDFVIEFEAEEDGIYYFAFRLMGWTKSVLRATDVIIDGGERCRIAYDYAEADQYKDHYFYGVAAELEAGKHTVALSLTEDFDDKNVKTVYMTDMYYYSEPIPEAPAEDAPAATAPATFDAVTLAAAVLALSAAGVAVSKKRK